MKREHTFFLALSVSQRKETLVIVDQANGFKTPDDVLVCSSALLILPWIGLNF